MREQATRVLRIPSQASVVTVVDRERRSAALDLDALYADALDHPATTSVSPVPGVELLVTGPPAPPPGAHLLWGSAWSPTGPATDDELVEVLHDPPRARTLTGRFLLVGAVGDALRLVVSADVVHVLHRADHGGATAWSTKALGAVTALGRRAELDESAVAELVLLDFVLGDRTIVRGVTVLEEATTTDIGAGGSVTSSWWPRDERLALGPPTSAAELAGFPGDERRQLDALYAYGRMRKWLGRSRPIPGQDAPTAAFLAPDVVRCLLDLPAGGFDEALALGPDLRNTAAVAVRRAGAQRSLLRRVRDRYRSPLQTDVGNLGAMLQAAGDTLDPVRRAVGDEWWTQAQATASTSTRNRLSLWNAVAVAGFVAWAAERKNAFHPV